MATFLSLYVMDWIRRKRERYIFGKGTVGQGLYPLLDECDAALNGFCCEGINQSSKLSSSGIRKNWENARKVFCHDCAKEQDLAGFSSGGTSGMRICRWRNYSI